MKRPVHQILAVITLMLIMGFLPAAYAGDTSGKSKKEEGLKEIAPSIAKGEKAAGIMDKLTQGIGKLVDKLLPAPGAETVGDAAGKTAKAGAKAVKDHRIKGDAVISDKGDLKIWNEKTQKWEDF